MEPELELDALVQQPAAVMYFVVNFVSFWDGTFEARIPVYISRQSLSNYYSMKLIERTILAKFQQHQSIEELKHVIDCLIGGSSFQYQCCEANNRFPSRGFTKKRWQRVLQQSTNSLSTIQRLKWLSRHTCNIAPCSTLSDVHWNSISSFRFLQRVVDGRILTNPAKGLGQLRRVVRSLFDSIHC